MLYLFCMRGCGCIGHPGFPCALCFLEAALRKDSDTHCAARMHDLAADPSSEVRRSPPVRAVPARVRGNTAALARAVALALQLMKQAAITIAVVTRTLGEEAHGDRALQPSRVHEIVDGGRRRARSLARDHQPRG